MSLDGIAVFVKVIEAGSFTAAAKGLNMPKATVSAKVAALENRLGVRLIQRTTRKLRLTEDGAKYFHHCSQALREVALGEAALRSAQEKPSGLLKIAAPVDIAHTALPRIACAYLERHPGTRVELLVSNRVVDLVGEGVDLAIRNSVASDSLMIAKRFLNVRNGLWASPHYLSGLGLISHPKRLSDARFIVLTDTKNIRLMNGRIQFDIVINSRTVADDRETIKNFALLGEGIGLLPDFLVADAVEAGTLVPVLPDWNDNFTDTFYLVYAAHKYTPPKVKAFVEIALHVIETRSAEHFTKHTKVPLGNS